MFSGEGGRYRRGWGPARRGRDEALAWDMIDADVSIPGLRTVIFRALPSRDRVSARRHALFRRLFKRIRKPNDLWLRAFAGEDLHSEWRWLRLEVPRKWLTSDVRIGYVQCNRWCLDGITDRLDRTVAVPYPSASRDEIPAPRGQACQRMRREIAPRSRRRHRHRARRGTTPVGRAHFLRCTASGHLVVSS